MQVPDAANDAFPRILQTLTDLMSQHRYIRALDEKTLSQYDEEVDALQSVQRQLEGRAALVRRKRNTFAPVNALPPELLVTIFEIVIHSECVQFWSNHQALVLVCHHWNHLFSNTPSLWTKIKGSAETSNVIITRALEMSQDSPLDVDYDGTDGSRALDRQHAFLSTIFPHTHRWRKATLSIYEAAQALEPMTTLSAPLLESLFLWACDDPAWARDEPLDIFGGRPPPRLQELTLNIPVPWNPKTLCNLKALRIMSIEHLTPSLDQLFAILPASPGLETLSINNVTFSGGASAPIPNPLHMPTLQKLSLILIPPVIINRILAAIRAPKCKFGSLRPTVPVDPVETLLTPDISHFFHHFRSGAGAGTIFCNIGGVGIYWEGPWDISLEVENIRMARRILDWIFVSPEPNSPAVPFRLAIDWSDPLMVEDIVAVMADTEAVYRVDFGDDAPLAGTLGMFATGGLEEAGARTPVFPRLKEIFIHKSLDDDEWENLLRMLHGRQGDIETRDGDHRVNPLNSLEFGTDWYMEDEESFINEFNSIHCPSHLEEVRKLLGHDGKLRWYKWMVAEDGTLEQTPRWGS
ncbi:hypothetical protein FS837_004689 [Tulasnella sp. UAMH 9824]|nr:hypothetical protein FS837_004689 [Tulasnella sp. UAMH 9824]